MRLSRTGTTSALVLALVYSAFVIVIISMTATSALAAEVVKSLEPGKALEFTNKKATEALITVDAEEESFALDYMSYPAKGDGDPSLVIASASASIDVYPKGRLVISLPSDAPRALSLNYDSSMLSVKASAKPAADRVKLELGATVVISGAGTDATAYIAQLPSVRGEGDGNGGDEGSSEGAEGAAEDEVEPEISYDLAIFKDKTELDSLHDSANDSEVSVPGKGRAVITALKGLLVTYSPLELKAAASTQPAITKRAISPGQNVELKNSGDERTVSVYASAPDALVIVDLSVYDNKGNVLQQEIGAELSSFSLPGKATAVVSVDAASAAGVVLSTEASAIKMNESQKPAIGRISLSAGQTGEFISIGKQENKLMLYPMSDTSDETPIVDYVAYARNGKLHDERWGTETSNIDIPLGGKVVVTVSQASPSGVSIVYDVTGTTYAPLKTAALERHVLVAGQGIALANESPDEVTIYMADDGMVKLDYCIIRPDGFPERLEFGTGAQTLILASRHSAFISASPSVQGSVAVSFRPNSVRATTQAQPSIRHKTLLQGSAVTVANPNTERTQLLLTSAVGTPGETEVTYAVHKPGDLTSARTVEVGVERLRKLYIEPGKSFILAIPASSPASVDIAWFEPLLSVSDGTPLSASLYPTQELKIRGSLRLPERVSGYIVSVSGPAHQPISKELSSIPIPNATDVSLDFSYQPKDGIIATPGKYRLVFQGQRADGSGASFEMLSVEVDVLSAFTSFEARYDVEKDEVKVTAVTKPGLTKPQEYAGAYTIPVVVGVKDLESAKPFFGAFGGGDFTLKEIAPDTFEGTFKGNSFERGHRLAVWPVVLGLSQMMDAPLTDVVELFIPVLTPAQPVETEAPLSEFGQGPQPEQRLGPQPQELPQQTPHQLPEPQGLPVQPGQEFSPQGLADLFSLLGQGLPGLKGIVPPTGPSPSPFAKAALTPAAAKGLVTDAAREVRYNWATDSLDAELSLPQPLAQSAPQLDGLPFLAVYGMKADGTILPIRPVVADSKPRLYLTPSDDAGYLTGSWTLQDAIGEVAEKSDTDLVALICAIVQTGRETEYLDATGWPKSSVEWKKISLHPLSFDKSSLSSVIDAQNSMVNLKATVLGLLASHVAVVTGTTGREVPIPVIRTDDYAPDAIIETTIPLAVLGLGKDYSGPFYVVIRDASGRELLRSAPLR